MSETPQPSPPPSPDDPQEVEREGQRAVSSGMVRAAIVFEGMIVVGAYFLGEIVERPPLDYIAWNLVDALWGLAAAVPMLAALWIAMRLPMPAIRRLHDICHNLMIPMFHGATWPQVVALCVFGGLGEEMLFRGLVQQGLTDAIGSPYGVWIGLLAASVTFGLAHAVSRAYAVVAGLIGLYLGGVLLLADNLLVAVVAHAVYDLGAFVYLFRMEREGEVGAEVEDASDESDNANVLDENRDDGRPDENAEGRGDLGS